MNHLEALAVAVVLAGVAEGANAQCPDGSPPPCGQSVTPASRTVRIDPSRVAVLPFRVTTADSLLGEGLAELIAAELSSEGGPRAVHMGSVLRSWRSAGGGLRTPLSQTQSARVGRDLGAGFLVEGSVVGIGQRLRITAALVSTQTGRSIGVDPVSGSADSLEMLVRRVTSGVLSAAGHTGRRQPVSSLSDSPDAMRAYLEGLARWRRNSVPPAMLSFERAWELDTLFASAAFMRYRMGGWLNARDNALWAERVRTLRHRLSREDQLLSVAYLGEDAVSLMSARMDNRRRIAARLPESPDAQYLLGDWSYHYGLQHGDPDWFGQAGLYFERALALDTINPIVRHLQDHALVSNDTARMRAMWGALDAPTEGDNSWSIGWLIANRLGDQRMISQRRTDAQEHRRSLNLGSIGVLGVSPAELDELHGLIVKHGTDREKESARSSYWVAAVIQGRPAAAAAVVNAAGANSNPSPARVLAALFADADSADAASAATRLASGSRTDSAAASGARCAVAHWRLRLGQDVAADEADLRRSGALVCAEGLSLGRALRIENVPDSLLLHADSVILTLSALYVVGTSGFERFYVAEAWKRRGDYRRALKAIRARATFQGQEWTVANDNRLEGWLAAVVGDTVGARWAYRRYLQVRSDPEPRLVPQRDSVRAELARLK